MKLNRSTRTGAVTLAAMLAFGACSNSSTEGSGSTPDGSGQSGSGGSGTGGAPVGGQDAASGGGSGGSPLADSGAPESTTSTDGSMAMGDAPSNGNGYGGVMGLEDLSTVKKSPGCGMPAPQMDTAWHAYTMTTPMTRLGSLMRTYHLKLPPNYDNNKAYRLIFQGTNCTGCPTCVMAFDTVAGAEGVIQVALERRAGSACFDDQSPMSVDYPFAEAADAELRGKLCFDEHRVFINGHSSGSWLTNEVGCIYASAPQPGPAPPGGPLVIRAAAPHSGGLPMTTPCSTRPMPGMWTHNHDDPMNNFNGSVFAINRALKVNGCMGTYGNSPTAPYPAPGTNDTCHIYTTCPKEFPVILCDPATGGHEGNKFFAANWQFFMSF
jgi:poly(3-hydroxybutyrate) depolymerase